MSGDKFPSVDDVPARRHAEVMDALTSALVCDWPMMGAERDFADEVVKDLSEKGFQIVRTAAPPKAKAKKAKSIDGNLLRNDVRARAVYAVDRALDHCGHLPRDLQVGLILSFLGEYGIGLKMGRPD